MPGINIGSIEGGDDAKALIGRWRVTMYMYIELTLSLFINVAGRKLLSKVMFSPQATE